MKQFIKYKPITLFLITIGLIPILCLIASLFSYILGVKGANFCTLLIVGGVIGFHLTWINTIFLSLDLINVKNSMPSYREKTQIIFIVLLSIYLLKMIVSLPYFESIELKIGMVLNILIRVVGIILVTYLFYKISDTYILLTKNRTANIWDYFIMLFYFCFLPFGLIMLHSHVKILMKDHNIVIC